MTVLALIVVAALGGHRAAMAIAVEDVIEGTRERFVEWSINGSKLREKIGDLVQCPYCLGFWLTGVAYAAAVTALGSWSGTSALGHLLAWWAAAGLQTLVTGADLQLRKWQPSIRPKPGRPRGGRASSRLKSPHRPALPNPPLAPVKSPQELPQRSPPSPTEALHRESRRVEDSGDLGLVGC